MRAIFMRCGLGQASPWKPGYLSNHRILNLLIFNCNNIFLPIRVARLARLCRRGGAGFLTARFFPQILDTLIYFFILNTL
jgi:hypothetical protein